MSSMLVILAVVYPVLHSTGYQKSDYSESACPVDVRHLCT
uniref:Uncharacterized protein n=1 Tax=Arundo donax TaxID=35708 RepID=A0A0A9C031_ARUDO